MQHICELITIIPICFSSRRPTSIGQQSLGAPVLDCRWPLVVDTDARQQQDRFETNPVIGLDRVSVGEGEFEIQWR